MKISTLIQKLQKILDDEGDKVIVVDSEHASDFVDVLDVLGKDYMRGNGFFYAYLLIDEPLYDELED